MPAKISVTIDDASEKPSYTAILEVNGEPPVIIKNDMPVAPPQTDPIDRVIASWTGANFSISSALIIKSFVQRCQEQKN